jgi:hypothetical protein
MTPEQRLNVIVNLARSVDPSCLLMREILALHSERSTLIEACWTLRKQSSEYLSKLRASQLACEALESHIDGLAVQKFIGQQDSILLEALREAIVLAVPLLTPELRPCSIGSRQLRNLCLIAGVDFAASPPQPDAPPTEWPTDVDASPNPVEKERVGEMLTGDSV